MDDPLPQDEDALAQWQAMRQGQPSQQALPPATGGLRWAWWVLGGLGLMALIALLLALLGG